MSRYTIRPEGLKQRKHENHSWKSQKISKGFNVKERCKQKNNIFHRSEVLINYKYSGNSHVPRRCPAYVKRCSQCEKGKLFWESFQKPEHIHTTRDDDRLRAVHEVQQDNEETDVTTQEFDVVIYKDFSFYSIRSVLIAKVKENAIRNQKCANLR